MRRLGLLLPLVLLLLAFTLSACGASTGPKTTLDIQGIWAMQAVVGNAHFPQTLHITQEDMKNGTWAGNDIASNGATLTVTGTIDNADVTFKTTNGSYTSEAKGKVTHPSSGAWTLTGTFDDGKSKGTFSATRIAGTHATMLP